MSTARKICLLLSVLLLLGSLVACDRAVRVRTDEDMIRDRIDAFLLAYNTGDFDGVLACMDRQSRRRYESMANLISGIGVSVGAGPFGVSGNLNFRDMFGYSVNAFSDGELMDAELVRIEPDEQDADRADVYVVLTLKSNFGEVIDRTKFELRREDGDWYIHDMHSYTEDGPESVSDES